MRVPPVQKRRRSLGIRGWLIGAAVVRDRGQKRAGAVADRVRACTRADERLQAEGDVDGLARRAALVRLQRVTEPSVRVAVALERLDDAVRGSAVEEAGEEPPLEQPALELDERARGLEGCHGGTLCTGRNVRFGA